MDLLNSSDSLNSLHQSAWKSWASADAQWPSPGLALVATAIVLVSFQVLLWWTKKTSIGKLNVPPGPKPVPFLGNLNLLKGAEMPQRLWEICGRGEMPVMSFKFPNRQSYVISSPEASHEMLVTKGTIFASRFSNTSSKDALTKTFDKKVQTGALFTPYGATWRFTRKVIVQGILESKKMHGDSFVLELLEDLCKRIDNAEMVNGEREIMARNMICKSSVAEILLHFCFGRGAERFAEEWNPLNDKFFHGLDVGEFVDWFFPTFVGRIFNPLYNQFVMKKLLVRIFQIFEELLADKERKHSSYWALADSVKEFEKEGKINHEQALHIYHEVCFGGQDTTTFAMEGVFRELAKHPEMLAKVQEEMDRVLGEGRKLRYEDVDRLPYFRAVIKECLRIHRALPILSPHYCMADTTLGGYDIPKGSSVLVNLWGISNDPNFYPDPEEVKPERFLNWDVNFTGQDGRYIIFGAGQRYCPGMNLALMMLHMVVGTLAQRYTWTLPRDWKEAGRGQGTFAREEPLRLCFTRRKTI